MSEMVSPSTTLKMVGAKLMFNGYDITRDKDLWTEAYL